MAQIEGIEPQALSFARELLWLVFKTYFTVFLYQHTIPGLVHFPQKSICKVKKTHAQMHVPYDIISS